MTTYCLFEGRHELPPNNGCIFTGFDFVNFVPIANPKTWQPFHDKIKNGETVKLIVTGLTPALTYLLALIPKDCKLILLHYDNERKCYQEQYFGNNGQKWAESREYIVYRKKISSAEYISSDIKGALGTDIDAEYLYGLDKNVYDQIQNADISTAGYPVNGYTSISYVIQDVDEMPNDLTVKNAMFPQIQYRILGLPPSNTNTK